MSLASPPSFARLAGVLALRVPTDTREIEETR